MTTNPKPRPAKAPCFSCPYRRDVPSGVWAESEYATLPEYDKETGEQPIGVFYCHQQDGRVCAGWAATHDMDECLALRMALAVGTITLEDADAIRDYTTSVPLFESGLAAATHGRARLKRPDAAARKTIQRLLRKIG